VSGDRRFSYHRAVAPMLWVLTALSGIELLVLHLLVSHWSPTAALLLSAVTLAGIVWLVVAIASMKRLPVVIGHDRLILRTGRFRRLDVSLADVAGLRREWNQALVKHRSTLNLALVAYPNVVVELRQARPGRRGIKRVAHRLDDPGAFEAGLVQALDVTRPAAAAPLRSGNGSGP